MDAKTLAALAEAIRFAQLLAEVALSIQSTLARLQQSGGSLTDADLDALAAERRAAVERFAALTR